MTNVLLTTNYGEIELELNDEAAPLTVANFLSYVDKGHYDGTIFHRVMDTFMIQGGGFTEDMTQKPTDAPIQNEADNGLSNDTGSIAMARLPDPHSASAQFFINVKDNDFLNFSAPNASGWGYCVFGKVVSGMETVEKIKNVPTSTSGPHENVPVDPVIIIKAARKG